MVRRRMFSPPTRWSAPARSTSSGSECLTSCLIGAVGRSNRFGWRRPSMPLWRAGGPGASVSFVDARRPLGLVLVKCDSIQCILVNYPCRWAVGCCGCIMRLHSMHYYRVPVPVGRGWSWVQNAVAINAFTQLPVPVGRGQFWMYNAAAFNAPCGRINFPVELDQGPSGGASLCAYWRAGSLVTGCLCKPRSARWLPRPLEEPITACTKVLREHFSLVA